MRPVMHAEKPSSLDAGHVTCDACWKAIPFPVNRMTDTCKNITLPKLHLRAVKTSQKRMLFMHGAIRTHHVGYVAQYEGQ